MRIVLTGASGFVGRELAPLLIQAGAKVVLIGRDPSYLAYLFPGEQVGAYDQIGELGQRFDALVHLAAINNNVVATPSEFHEVNVRLTMAVREQARRAGIKRFINVSSTHALDKFNHSPYAASKREAARLIRDCGDGTITLFLPAVHGSKRAGKLALLNSLPKSVSRVLHNILSALRPTISVNKLKEYIINKSLSESNTDVILTDGQKNNVLYGGSKRLIDISFALLIASLLWWLMAAVWIAIRLQSKGPGIFAQQRVGRNGEIFTCYKFRTMKLGTVQAATNEVSSDAVTRFGHVLRRTKIDELPQIWNILRNEISLVGPRPCLPIQQALIDKRREYGVLELTPGITGLAQINGIDMSDPENLARWDQRYGQLQSLLLDMKIILATALGCGQGDKVAK